MSTLRVDNIKSRTGTVVTIPDTHTLAVTGIASVSGDINVSGNELITGVSTVSGTQTINGTQTVNGTQAVSGNQTISGSITYNTGAHFNNPSGIVTTGTLNVVGTTSFGSIGAATTSMVIGAATTIHADGIDLGRVGVITAATFSGNASGLNGTPNITVRDITANNITGVAATFTGVVTYEDVASVDAIGIITARQGINVSASGVNVSSGVVTATSFEGRHGRAPTNAQSGGYSLVLTDAGKVVITTSGGVTVPQSIFSAGDIISVVNNTAGNVTITQGSGTSLKLAGTSTTGNRTLAQRGIASIVCIGANDFIISGSGLT